MTSYPPNGDVASHAKVSRVENLIGRRIGENRFGVDSGLVSECAESGDVVVTAILSDPHAFQRRGTHKGTCTSTASATRFSISRSMCNLYLLLT